MTNCTVRQNDIKNIRCHVFEKFLAQSKQEASCWGLAKKIDDFRYDYNVCQDCIVYIYSIENNGLARQRLENIFHERSNIQQ